MPGLLAAPRREATLYFSAQQFLTRLPAPGWTGWEADRLARAARYFPAVGALLGLVAGGVFWLAAPLGGALAAGLALGLVALLTGALHEDGFADCCDGVGGARGGARALEIMRDSRIGAFGAAGLVFVIGLRWAALGALGAAAGLAALVVALAAARAAILPALAFGRYARAEGAATGAAGGLQAWELAFGVVLAALVAAGAAGATGLAALLAALAVGALWHLFMARRLGGYTGDTLGGAEQAAQTAALIVFAGAAA